MSRLSRLGFIDTRRTLDPVRRRIRSRGVPPALDGHEVFCTEDSHEAEQLLVKVFGPVHLTLGEVGSAGFAAAMHGVRFRDVSLLYLDLHIASTLDLAECGPAYLVLMPMNGRAVGSVAGHDFEANTIRALVLNPGDTAQIRLDHDSPQLLVRVEQAALESHLMRLTGRMLSGALRFDWSFDLTTDAATRWHGAVQLLHTEVFYAGSLVQAGRGIGALEEFLMSSLLLVHTSSHADLLQAVPPKAGRRTVLHAIDFIERHLSEPITMSDLADNSRASVRSIQQGFRDELGVTPMEYVRDRRLERVRQELLDAEPADGVTVTGVASHWGFNHLGSFAGLYRRRYGESPSATLRR